MRAERAPFNSNISVCLLLAQSGHPDPFNQCPLLGVKRTSAELREMSAENPKTDIPFSLPLRCTTSLPNVGGTKLGHLRWELFRFLRCAILGAS